MRKRPLYYGWHDPKRIDRRFFVSFAPPDATIRRAARFETLEDVAAWLDRKRANIMWWPPLSYEQNLQWSQFH